MSYGTIEYGDNLRLVCEITSMSISDGYIHFHAVARRPKMKHVPSVTASDIPFVIRGNDGNLVVVGKVNGETFRLAHEQLRGGDVYVHQPFKLEFDRMMDTK